jgi:hypothetical protein
VVNSEKNEKRRTVYLKIKGPEESAARLRTFFVKTAEESGLLLNDDRHKAGSTIELTIQEKDVEGELYADLISATLHSHDGKSATVYSCKLVEDGKGFSTITKKKGKTGLVQADIAIKGTVFVEEAKELKYVGSVATVKKEMSEAGFQIITGEKEADVSLTNVKLIKVPLHSKSTEIRVESTVSPAGSRTSRLTTNFRLHSTVTEPIGAEAEDCRSSIEKISGDDSVSYSQIAQTDLALISNQLR